MSEPAGDLDCIRRAIADAKRLIEEWGQNPVCVPFFVMIGKQEGGQRYSFAGNTSDAGTTLATLCQAAMQNHEWHQCENCDQMATAIAMAEKMFHHVADRTPGKC